MATRAVLTFLFALRHPQAGQGGGVGGGWWLRRTFLMAATPAAAAAELQCEICPTGSNCSSTLQTPARASAKHSCQHPCMANPLTLSRGWRRVLQWEHCLEGTFCVDTLQCEIVLLLLLLMAHTLPVAQQSSCPAIPHSMRSQEAVPATDVTAVPFPDHCAPK
jgi:hypothetical protein